MPAHTPQPASDQPAPAGGCLGPHVDTPRSDEHALIGYECALPWLQLALTRVDAATPIWSGGPAD